MNIRIKIPSMAQFIPSSILRMVNPVFSSAELFDFAFGDNHIKYYRFDWYMDHAKVTFQTDLNHKMSNRLITVDGETYAWFRDTPGFLLDTTEHTFKSVVMSLRDYYIKHVDEYLHKYTFGYDENLILIQWMEHPASGFQHIIKRSDWVYNPFTYDLDHLITGFVRSNRYKITRQIDEDIKITVSPCQ